MRFLGTLVVIDMLLIAAVAVAAEAPLAVTATNLKGKAKEVNKVFVLEPGGCLRGPLKVFDGKGKVLFSLASGVHYPMACGDQQ